ncbi:MAG: outer membrane lipoprotein-sorting protein [Acidobacteriota bacterium]
MKRDALQIGRLLIVASVLGLVSLANLPLDQPLKAATGGQQALVSNPSATETTTGDLVFAKLVEFNRRRESRLEQYSVRGTYRVENAKGEMSAESQVLLSYRAPGTKAFKIISEKGSGLIRSRVFKPLMEVEVETAAVRNRNDSSITPNNYTFELLGEEDVNGYHCFVVQAIPKRADKYLFKGKVWIHAEEFAVVQIEGQPAVSPSAWIKRVDFVRRYQKVGGFWLPLNNQSITRVRIFGKNTLTTAYDNYQINQALVAAP